MSENKPSLQDTIRKFNEVIAELSVVLLSTLFTEEQEEEARERYGFFMVARDAMRAQLDIESKNPTHTTQHQFILSELSTPEKMARWFIDRNMEASFDFCENRPECQALLDRDSSLEDEQCLQCLIKFLNTSGEV